MKYLKLTDSVNPQNPKNGYPYVFYNNGIEKVWIFLGIRWILENAHWGMNKSWANSGRWNYYGPPVV